MKNVKGEGGDGDTKEDTDETIDTFREKFWVGDRVAVLVDPATGEVAVHPKETGGGSSSSCCGSKNTGSDGKEAPAAEAAISLDDDANDDTTAEKKSGSEGGKTSEVKEAPAAAVRDVPVPGAIRGRTGTICWRLENEDNFKYRVEFDADPPAEAEGDPELGQGPGQEPENVEAQGCCGCCPSKEHSTEVTRSAELEFWQLVRVSSPLDEQAREAYPDRGWDEEELDELEDEPNALFVILELFFYPLRIFLYKVFCEVQRVKKIRAESVDLDDAGPNAEEDDNTIDGFDIDCGTKERKFLSMAKCKAVTMTKHPNLGVQVSVRHGDEEIMEDYVQPYELWRDTGQHSLSEHCCFDFKKQTGCWRKIGFMQKYGIG